MSENFQETELNENQIYLQGISSKEQFPQFQESKNKKKTELYPSELEIKKKELLTNRNMDLRNTLK